MAAKPGIPRDDNFRSLWTSDLTVAQIAAQYGVNRNTVSRTARSMGLASRRKGGGSPSGLPKPETSDAVPTKLERLIELLAQARDERRIPVPPRWTFDMDLRLITGGGRHADIAACAGRWGMAISRVRARWHILRGIV